MLGYFLGHYKQEFALTDDQRNLILQTYLFFIWLAGGGAVFSALETRYGTVPWSFVDGLYFCDVTILTVGFGDLTPTDNIGRGIVFPYSVGGIIMLGLVISSISNFTGELGQDNIVKGHVQRARIRTIGRTVTSSSELEERTRAQVRIPAPPSPERRRSSIYSRFKERNRTLHYADENGGALAADRISKPTNPVRQGTFKKTFKRINTPRIRKPKLILMREERDRFNAMREIQRSTAQFKRWASLSMSALAFGVLWCVGAVVFWKVERGHQEMDYFQALYFCYVSLLTIGYGDFAPKSNAGRPFFIVWSLIAVPTMTVLISHMGDTVISSFKQGTVTVADWTLLPKKGLFRAFLERNPWLMNWIIKKKEKKEANKRVEEGFQTGLDETDTQPCRTIDALASEQLTEHALARKLAYAIRDTAGDLKLDKQKRYSYEDWVEFTRLIRFTSKHGGNNFSDEEEEGLIDWDWIGEESPMMSGQTEAEFVLDRLCESMTRYIRHQIVAKNIERRESNGGETNSEETRGQGDSEKNLELQ
ncbi:MAG: Potassium channel [Bogoriella megaspora]|nr:MAG: Potassium channel [Bogoriella megaspora]